MDDRSVDGTRQILGAWAERDSRVRVLRTDGNYGLVPALNLAVRAARSPLLARMDADDVALPRRLELQVEHMRADRSLAACGSGVELFPAELVGDGYSRYEGWLNGLRAPDDVWRDLLVECPLAHPALVVRDSVLQGLDGYRDAGWPEDYDLVLRIHAAGMRAGNLPDVLLRWRVRPGRHSLASERYSAEAFRRCKAHFLRETFLPPARPLVIWGAGKVGKPLARELIRQGSRIRAFVDLDPRKIGQEIHGAPVLDPAGFAALAHETHPYVLAAVGSPGARKDIRRALADAGCVEIDDYRICA